MNCLKGYKTAFGIAFLMLVFQSISWAQTGFEFEKSFEAKANAVVTDNMGALYLIRKAEIEKRNAQGKNEEVNSGKLFGNIHSMDASNALKVVVFFKNLSLVSIRDNRLAERGEAIVLDKMGLAQASAVAQSYNNGLWVYDAFQFQLIRFDEQFRETNRTPNLMNMVRRAIEPAYLMESNRQVFLADPGYGVYVFDVFGTLAKQIPFEGASYLSVQGNILYVFSDTSLMIYNMRTFDIQTLKLPVDKPQSVAMHNTSVYILKDNKVQLYKLSF